MKSESNQAPRSIYNTTGNTEETKEHAKWHHGDRVNTVPSLENCIDKLPDFLVVRGYL